MIINCSFCGKQRKVKPYIVKHRKNIFCSKKCKNNYQLGKPTWNKGIKLLPLTEEHKKKIGTGVKNSIPWQNSIFNTIKIITSKSVRKKAITSLKLNGRLKGKNNPMYGRRGILSPHWKGGSSYWRKEYYNTFEYRQWRAFVFKRDNYICQVCGIGHITKKKKIHAHHIKQFALFPEYRLDVKYGITVCCDCHVKIHSKNGGVINDYLTRLAATCHE